MNYRCFHSDSFLCQVGRLWSGTKFGLITQTQVHQVNPYENSSNTTLLCLFYSTCVVVGRKDGSHGPLLNSSIASVWTLDRSALKAVFHLATQWGTQGKYIKTCSEQQQSAFSKTWMCLPYFRLHVRLHSESVQYSSLHTTVSTWSKPTALQTGPSNFMVAYIVCSCSSVLPPSGGFLAGTARGVLERRWTGRTFLPAVTFAALTSAFPSGTGGAVAWQLSLIMASAFCGSWLDVVSFSCVFFA